MTRLLIACAFTASIALAPASASAADRPFSQRFTLNAHGDARIIGNTSLNCPDPPTATCTSARTGIGGSLNNNDHSMAYIDVDADAATFNSSRATLSIPSGAEVRFAGLYWGGQQGGTGAGAGAPPPDAGKSNELLFDTPAAGGSTSLTATSFEVANGTPEYVFFGAVADVTSLVAAAGPGEYTVANIQAGTGFVRHGGWALVVIFEDPAEPIRNLTVFDGLILVTTPSPNVVDIPISGYLTPPSGAVKTSLGAIAYDGDLAGTGDSLQIEGQVVSDALNPATNFFNSTVSAFESLFTAKLPNQVNQFGGVDADLIDVSGFLPNNDSSTTIRIQMTSEGVYAAAAVFATELYAPNLAVTKTVSDIDGGDILPGDVLEYEITVASNGADAAADVVLRDPVPAGTSLVAASLVVDGTLRTDVAGDDVAEHDAQGRVVARLGAGASSSAGGTLNPGQSALVRFRVRVSNTATAGQTITNSAPVTVRAATGGFPLSFESAPASRTVSSPPAPVPAPVPAPAPASPPPTTPPAGLVLADVVTLPATKRCVSRRRFRIRLVEPTGDRIASARVLVNGKLVKTVRGARLTAPVDLRSLPKGRFSVRIEVVTKSGRKVSGTRRYRTCTPKRSVR